MMKRILKLTLIVAASLLASTAFGQKFAYINSQELIFSMPEVDSVNAKLELMEKDYIDALELIQVEFNNKLNDYQKNATTYTDTIRQMKEQELTEINQRYEQYQQAAAQDMQNQQAVLMQPVYEKANNAIQKVAKANSFVAVFDLSVGSMLYFDEEQMVNMLPLVYAELGIDPAAAAAKLEAATAQPLQ